MKPGLIDQVLQLQTIGMRVGDRLQLEKSMRWVQIADQKGNSFWTIRGLGVESLVGGMTGYYVSFLSVSFGRVSLRLLLSVFLLLSFVQLKYASSICVTY